MVIRFLTLFDLLSMSRSVEVAVPGSVEVSVEVCRELSCRVAVEFLSSFLSSFLSELSGQGSEPVRRALRLWLEFAESRPVKRDTACAPLYPLLSVYLEIRSFAPCTP